MDETSLVTLTGQLVCRSEAEADTVRRQLSEHLRLTRAEPGCLLFAVTPTSDPLIWQVAEQFRTPESFRAHQARVRDSAWGRATADIERRYTVDGM